MLGKQVTYKCKYKDNNCDRINIRQCRTYEQFWEQKK